MIPAVALWLVVTIAHIALTVRAVHRIWPAATVTLDERLFASVAAIVGSLSIVLHLTALTAGIGLATVTIALIAWHAALGLASRRVPGTARVEVESRTTVTVVERLAATALLAILLTWVGLAAASGDVLGPDAAHYHVPYAVNFAAGASPFSLPATPHLYPMAASVISAWFIVPTGDPLLVDLAMALPFALLIVSINLLFRAATGRSGLAWASWLGLALFATPMFRTASQGSADLWFAASFVALIAAIVRAGAIGRWTTSDLLLAAAVAGLLVGSKTTGAPALVLIVGAAMFTAVVRRVAGGPRIRWPWNTKVLVGAVLVCVAAGGVWLIRNWLQFGSPFAPAGLALGGYTIFPGETFQQTTYLSVLGEMQTKSFHLLPRAEFYVEEWFGTWYLPALSPILVLLIDLVMTMRRRRTIPEWWSRLDVLVMTILAGGILTWLLMGAPWTALERSHGLTLRYVLPVAALLPLLALIGVVPIGLNLYARLIPRILVAMILGGGVVRLWWLAITRPDPTQPAAFAPGVSLAWFVVALVLASMLTGSSGRRVAVAVLLLIAVISWAPAITRADARVRAEAQQRLDADAAVFSHGEPFADTWREPLPAVIAAERKAGVSCDWGREFFSLVRFDEPLTLQSPGSLSLVYYAGRDENRFGAVRASGADACTYMITTQAMQATLKGQRMAWAATVGTGSPMAWDSANAPRPFAMTANFFIFEMPSK